MESHTCTVTGLSHPAQCLQGTSMLWHAVLQFFYETKWTYKKQNDKILTFVNLGVEYMNVSYIILYTFL